MKNIDTFLDETLDLACLELKSRFGSAHTIRVKENTSLVTDTDLAVEKIILDRLNKFFPSDAIISEESGIRNLKRSPGQKVWIIDPLDGTTNFAHGYPFFSVSIGYAEFQEDGQLKVIAGAIGDPIHQNKYLAMRGKGSFCNGKSIKIRKDRPFGESFLVTGFYYTLGDDLNCEIERFRMVAQQCQSIRRDGSAALDLALVAAGVYDGFWERGLSIWDIAAGSLLVEEAGGNVLNYPNGSTQANSAHFNISELNLSYQIEGDGIIAGTSTVTQTVQRILKQ